MDDDNDLGPFWAAAIKAYELECDHPLDLGIQSGDLHTTDDLLRVIESRGDDFDKFRERNGQLWHKMKRFVDPITTVGNLTATVFNDNPSGVPVAAILKSITHLVAVSTPHLAVAFETTDRILDGPEGLECVRLDTDRLYRASRLLRPPEKSCQHHDH